MNQNKGMGGIYIGIVISVIGLLAMTLPFITNADMMEWGFGVMALGLFLLIAGIITLLLFRRRRAVLKRMATDGEVLARWTYDEAQWRKWQQEEVASASGMPIFGAILGGLFLMIGLVFFLVDPDEMGLMLAIMAGIGLIIAGAAWLSAVLNKRAVLRDPGEAVIARGGVWFMGFLTDWNGVTSWFGGAKVERKGKRCCFVVDYRFLAGRYPRIHKNQIRIPVPSGCEEEAEAAARSLNARPY